MQEWFDEEFFQTGAFLCEPSGKITFGKGGSTFWTSSLAEVPEECFILKDFFESNFLVYSPETTLVLKRDEINQIEEPVSFTTSQNDDDLYKKDFKSLKESFGEELKKVVLISRESYRSQDFKTARRHCIRRALTFDSGLPYGIWFSDYGMVGATPELLFQSQSDQLKTYALAGTMPLAQAEELLKSSKDREEHDYVIQNICESLKPFTQGIEVAKTGITFFKNLAHLRTDISAKLRPDVDLEKLLSTFSPSAALGGYPKKRALEFLKKCSYHQKHKNRFFGSALGMRTKKSANFLVCIRNVQWQGEEFCIESGGGVVEASTLENELREIRLKRKLISRSFLDLEGPE